MCILDLDSARAEEEFSDITNGATGIKTFRGSKYVFHDYITNVDYNPTLFERVGTAKFHIRPDAEIILDGMLCELPPGLHKNGKTRYAWINEPGTNGSVTHLPESLYNEIKRYAETRNQGTAFTPGELERLLGGLAEGEGRNEAAIRIAGHLIGKNNSWEIIETTLRGWNQKNRPPLSENELSGILKSAEKLFERHQIVIETRRSSPTSAGIECPELSAAEIRSRKEEHRDLRLTFGLPDDHFVSVFCNWLSGRTDGYTDYQELAALWLISSLCENRVELRLKQGIVRPNLWLVFLGSSTTSRKSTIVNSTRYIYESLTGAYLPNEDFSLEGYLEGLSINPVQNHVRDEAAGFLAKIHKQYNEGFLELECAIYDGQSYRKTLAAKGGKEPKVFEVTHPCVAKLYATAPEKFFRYVTVEDFLCGWGYRNLFVFPTYSKSSMPLSVETQADISKWIAVLERAKRIQTFISGRDKIIFDFEPDALVQFNQIETQLETDADRIGNDMLSSAVGRSETHILKLAMLLELGKEPISTIITQDSILTAATAVRDYFLPTIMSVIDRLQDDVKNNLIEKIISVLRKHGGCCQHSKALHDAKMKSRDFTECIQTLIEAETVETVIEKDTKKIYYILTDVKTNLNLSGFQIPSPSPSTSSRYSKHGFTSSSG